MLSRVELRKDGEAIGHFEVSAGNATSRQLIKQTLRSDEEITTTTLEKYTLVAFNEAGEQIVSTNRYMRFTPRASTHLNIPVNGTIAWDFSLQPDSFSAIYHYQGSEPEAGWSVKDGALVVFDGTTYKDMTNSAISFFLNVPAETESSPSVHIKADIDTEVDCDYLIVTVSHPKRGIMIVMAESGKKDIDQTFKLDR